jgi:hypothetical protein
MQRPGAGLVNSKCGPDEPKLFRAQLDQRGFAPHGTTSHDQNCIPVSLQNKTTLPNLKYKGAKAQPDVANQRPCRYQVPFFGWRSVVFSRLKELCPFVTSPRSGRTVGLAR